MEQLELERPLKFHGQGHLPLEQAAPSPIQPGCENFQGWIQGIHQGQVQGSTDLQPVPLLQPQIKPFLCLSGLCSSKFPCVLLPPLSQAAAPHALRTLYSQLLTGLLLSGSLSHSPSSHYSKKNICLGSNTKCLLIPRAGSKGKTLHHPVLLFIPLMGQAKRYSHHCQLLPDPRTWHCRGTLSLWSLPSWGRVCSSQVPVAPLPVHTPRGWAVLGSSGRTHGKAALGTMPRLQAGAGRGSLSGAVGA